VPLQLVTPALTALGLAAAKPLVAYPNSGETYDPVTKTWRPADAMESTGPHPVLSGELARPRSLAEGTGTWRELGARIIGGCCRTTPGDIAAIALAMPSH
jgi:homocysteine S-methyltransferase